MAPFDPSNCLLVFFPATIPQRLCLISSFYPCLRFLFSFWQIYILIDHPKFPYLAIFILVLFWPSECVLRAKMGGTKCRFTLLSISTTFCFKFQHCCILIVLICHFDFYSPSNSPHSSINQTTLKALYLANLSLSFFTDIPFVSPISFLCCNLKHICFFLFFQL